MNIKRRKCLKSTDLHIEAGSKVCILAVDKKSKDDFYSIFCSESFKKSGDFKCNGKISYINCKQRPFLTGESIKENIIFKSKVDIDKYESVLSAIGLDMNDFSNGDETLILKNGKNLSAKEARKILLARCIYQPASIFLIQNYFGHENSMQERSIYSKIMWKILRNKTVIFDTNVPSLIEAVDMVIKLKDNTITNITSN